MRTPFKVGDPIYILVNSKGKTQRVYGHVTDVWENGKIVDVRLGSDRHSWSYRSNHVYHAHEEANREVGNHVLC